MTNGVGHWMCTKYDDNGVIHVYDSLNLKSLCDEQINYLNNIYPFNTEYQFH